MNAAAEGIDVFADAYFNEWCHIETYGRNEGRIFIPTDSCYDHWVFGYGDLKRPRLTGHNNTMIDSPSLCQSHCQQDPKCFHFLWIEAKQGGYCFLKSVEQVETAVGTILDQKYPPPLDYSYDPFICPPDLHFLCSTDYAKCLKIDGTKRCIWNKDDAIGGPKYCEPTNISPELQRIFEFFRKKLWSILVPRPDAVIPALPPITSTSFTTTTASIVPITSTTTTTRRPVTTTRTTTRAPAANTARILTTTATSPLTTTTSSSPKPVFSLILRPQTNSSGILINFDVKMEETLPSHTYFELAEPIASTIFQQCIDCPWCCERGRKSLTVF
eukprot:Gregarina_sp_Poly_1__9995@NODE_664_length_6888_cov_103_167424_g502_i0_p3_GENE_NODE_664_length_6888_cov_103_167424_g502_i0NODE_664_length_6888_cov_103_167424_g502_i0_p3_ORF_typecomplete_len329_score22_62PAN_4/PF14295_6/3e06PAN_1/PF00024_26/0_0018KAR9/PF08580_10/4_1_NODE_664_length_6888_cov_103_167424_g502_i041835169